MSETQARRPRGRPRTFDEEAALDQLTELFRERGFSQTSVADLVEASGVHKPSLYRTFGSKEALFARCLYRYLEGRMAKMSDMIEAAGGGVDGIERFLDDLGDQVLADTAAPGCLLVASSAELRGTTAGFEDFGTSYRRSLRGCAAELVAKAGGSPEEIEARAAVVATWMLGFDIAVRGGAAQAEVRLLIEGLKAVVATWR